MSEAPSLALPRENSLTLRQFARALAVTAVILASGCFIYGIEKYVFHPRHRFIESPGEVMVRAFGVAHFLIGWLFLATSQGVRRPGAWPRLALVTAGGVGLCFVFHEAGGTRNPLVLISFYALFLVHEVRDERTMFEKYEEAPGSHNLLNSIATSACLILVTVLAAAYMIHQQLFHPDGRVTTYPAEFLWSGIGILACISIGAVLATHRQALRSYSDWRTFTEAHSPLLTVYSGILAILLLGSLFGSLGFNLIILVHVTAWLVFVTYQLRQRQVHVDGLWTWLRHTPAGFVTLHLVLAGGILLLLAIRVHVWQRAGTLSVLLASSSFPYWSLLHIATGFWKSAAR
jgi:hypothetical protein